MKNETEPFVFNKRFLSAVAFIFSANFLVGITLYFYKFRFGLAPDQETWGQFGDLYGGLLNPTLSFFTLLGLIYTIKLQTKGLSNSEKQLETSREELKLSRESIGLATKELENQNAKLTRQLFDSTYFNLLDFHHSIVNEISINTALATNSGRGCFSLLAEWQKSTYIPRMVRKSLVSFRLENIQLSADEIAYLRSQHRSNTHYSREADRIVYAPLAAGNMDAFYSTLSTQQESYRREFIETLLSNTNEVTLELVSKPPIGVSC